MEEPDLPTLIEHSIERYGLEEGDEFTIETDLHVSEETPYLHTDQITVRCNDGKEYTILSQKICPV